MAETEVGALEILDTHSICKWETGEGGQIILKTRAALSFCAEAALPELFTPSYCLSRTQPE